MASPNYYEPGSPVWQDMFPTYLFDGTEGTRMALNEQGDIIAVPVIMDPGSATAYYYNMDLAEELGIADVAATTSWKQLKENILTAREAGYTGTVVYEHGLGFEGGGSWDAQFSLNAAYFTPMIADNDFDGDGKVMSAEGIRKQYETGYWYLENNPAMVEYWNEYFWKIQHGMEDGALDIDYTQPWADGKVLYIEEGLWSIVKYASNTELTFEVGMFPPPYQLPADSEYVAEIPYTEAGPFQPTISVAFNIMDPAMQNRPEYNLDYVVDWMKWATTNDNLSIQIEEGEGVVGATKGCKVPTMLSDWFQQSFPKAPGGYASVQPNLTDLVSTSFAALNQEYAFGMIDEAQYIHDYDELLYQGLVNYIEIYPEKLAEWQETYGWSADDWSDPVKPSWM